jgi:uncharacterized protein
MASLYWKENVKTMKKIAIIGSGISGLVSAYYLQKTHQVTLYEANEYIGGHTATKTVDVEEGSFDIDTGFIVFNDWTYPNFIRLLNELDVEWLDTEMGFSVSCEASGLEYSGGSLATLFAQPSNLFKPKHWKMLGDIVTFNKAAKQAFIQDSIDESLTLGDYIDELGLGQQFRDKYIVPMGAAIWSCGLEAMLDFPARYFVRFFYNHGLLNVNERPTWRVIKGGSHQYVKKLIQALDIDIKLATPVTSVTSHPEGGVLLACQSSATQSSADRSGDRQPGNSQSGKTNNPIKDIETTHFDEVIFACHSDQALRLIETPNQQQQQVLSALPYQSNEVVLHTDTSLLPKRKSTWSSWNYRLKKHQPDLAVLTYDMNILQCLDTKTQFCVTLNDTDSIDPSKILGSYQYMHPVYNKGSIAAQSRRSEINGHDNLWFCGAYWYSGFHEDGVRSALDVAAAILAQSNSTLLSKQGEQIDIL